MRPSGVFAFATCASLALLFLVLAAPNVSELVRLPSEADEKRDCGHAASPSCARSHAVRFVGVGERNDDLGHPRATTAGVGFDPRHEAVRDDVPESGKVPVHSAARDTDQSAGPLPVGRVSDLASGVTGEIMYVDGGFNTVVAGME